MERLRKRESRDSDRIDSLKKENEDMKQHIDNLQQLLKNKVRVETKLYHFFMRWQMFDSTFLLAYVYRHLLAYNSEVEITANSIYGEEY